MLVERYAKFTYYLCGVILTLLIFNISLNELVSQKVGGLRQELHELIESKQIAIKTEVKGDGQE